MPKRTKNGRKKANQVFEADVNTSVALNDELQMKKDTLLVDFDLEVRKIVRSMQSEAKKMSTNIGLLLTNYLACLPQDVKKMTIEEFAEKGGNFETLSLDEVAEAVEDKIDTKRLPLTDQTNKQPTTVQPPSKKRTKRQAAAIASQLLTTSTRTTRSNARTVQKNAPQTSQFVTPMCNPRSAPLTTSRKPKKNEKIAYSINNSPLEIATPSTRPDLEYFKEVFDSNSPQFLTQVQRILDQKMKSVMKEVSK